MKKPRKFYKKNKASSSVKVNSKPKFEFPNISLIIPARSLFSLSKGKKLLWVWLIFILFLALVLVSFDLYKNYQKNEELLAKREEITQKIKYLENVVLKYKDYRDGYYQLAILEYNLGNFDKAKFYLQKTLELDPNFEKGRELEKLLN